MSEVDDERVRLAQGVDEATIDNAAKALPSFEDIMAAADAYALAVVNKVVRLFGDNSIDPDEAQAQLDALREKLGGKSHE